MRSKRFSSITGPTRTTSMRAQSMAVASKAARAAASVSSEGLEQSSIMALVSRLLEVAKVR